MAECQLEMPKAPGLEDGVLTVGRIFVLDCKGSFPKTENFKSWELILEENQDPYAIKFLDSNFLTPEEVQFFVTSYRVGHHDFKSIKLKNGPEILDLGPLNFEVQTVIEKQEAQVEPYGPMAITLAWPLSLWLTLATALVVIVVAMSLKIRRHLQRKALLEELRGHDSALTPIAEIHHKYRHWRREHSFFYLAESGGDQPQDELKIVLKEVDHSFRLFLTRLYRLPALKWSDRLILRELKRRHRQVFDNSGLDIQRFFMEMNKAQAASNLKPKDVVQITENFRKLAEKLDAIQRGGRK